MSTPTKKCGLVLYTPLYHLLTKILISNIPWENLSNFLGVVLEKFSVKV